MNVDPYKKDHEILGAKLGELQSQMTNVSANAKNIAKILAEISGALKMHLAKEDNSLYPALLKSSDTNVSSTAKKFQSEMGGLKDAWSNYINEWRTDSKISDNVDEFTKQTGGILKALGNRVQQEEKILYPMAEKAA